ATAVQGGDPVGDGVPGDVGGAGGAVAVAGGGAARPGGGVPQGAAQGARTALRQCPGTGRGPRAFRRRGADLGPSGDGVGTSGEVGAASSGGGGAVAAGGRVGPGGRHGHPVGAG